MLRVTLVIALALVLTVGLAMNGCSGKAEQNGSAIGRITGVSMDSTQSPQAGELAPDFYFETPEGEPSSLSDLAGSPVLLNFWATWCGPCRGEMPYLQEIYDGWQGKGLVLLAINIMESSSDVEGFMQSEGLTFTVLLDSEGEVAYQYGIRAIPTTFFIDLNGVIQEIKIGAFQSKAEIEESLLQLIGVSSD